MLLFRLVVLLLGIAIMRLDFSTIVALKLFVKPVGVAVVRFGVFTGRVRNVSLRVWCLRGGIVVGRIRFSKRIGRVAIVRFAHFTRW
jgi:hypothetical protein